MLSRLANRRLASSYARILRNTLVQPFSSTVFSAQPTRILITPPAIALDPIHKNSLVVVEEENHSREEEKESSSTKEGLKEIYFFLCLTAQLVLAYYFIEKYAVQVLHVRGPSMLPTLDSDSNSVLVDKITPAIKGVKKGDIVIAENPNKKNNLICKRVIWVEGETAEFVAPGETKVRKVLVPDNHVWLEGDNKLNSRDSRHFGPISLALVNGVVRCRVWPFEKIGRID